MGETCRDCEYFKKGYCSIHKENRDGMDDSCNEFMAIDVFSMDDEDYE